MDRFELMRTFISVVETGGISAAADALGIAKSAVSRRLAMLEGRLGTQLLTRTTRRVRVTDTGRGFYDRAVSILADLSEAEAAVASAQRVLRGRLRLAVPLSFGLAHLGPAIQEFAGLHPELTFDVDFSDRFVDLVQEGFDLGIRIGALPDSSLISRRLTHIGHSLCASPGYLAARGRPRTAEELVGHDWLRYSNQPADALPFVGPDGRNGLLRLRPVLSANNGDFLRDAAIAGRGLTLMPNFIVYEALKRRRLVALLPDHRWQRSTASAIYPPTRHLSLRVRRFIDFLIDRFGDTPYWDAPCLPQAIDS